ncbi:MAG: putative zinc-binding protein [Syntrophobacterales bacterium]|nr:putative zinc-binding protein [Syntrophobacterales bacterium]
MKNSSTLIMACCGAANVGQMTNILALELVREGYGNPFCLAGIGARRRGFIRSATENDTILIDGCSIGCGRLMFEQSEVPLKKYLVLTELGIEKSIGGEIASEDLEKARRALREICGESSPSPVPRLKTTSSCCG